MKAYATLGTGSMALGLLPYDVQFGHSSAVPALHAQNP